MKVGRLQIIDITTSREFCDESDVSARGRGGAFGANRRLAGIDSDGRRRTVAGVVDRGTADDPILVTRQPYHGRRRRPRRIVRADSTLCRPEDFACFMARLGVQCRQAADDELLTLSEAAAGKEKIQSKKAAS
jgi:hypothetical protein